MYWLKIISESDTVSSTIVVLTVTVWVLIIVYRNSGMYVDSSFLGLCTTTTEIGRIEWNINNITIYLIYSATPINDFRIINGSKIIFSGRELVNNAVSKATFWSSHSYGEDSYVDKM